MKSCSRSIHGKFGSQPNTNVYLNGKVFLNFYCGLNVNRLLQNFNLGNISRSKNLFLSNYELATLFFMLFRLKNEAFLLGSKEFLARETDSWSLDVVLPMDGICGGSWKGLRPTRKCQTTPRTTWVQCFKSSYILKIECMNFILKYIIHVFQIQTNFNNI